MRAKNAGEVERPRPRIAQWLLLSSKALLRAALLHSSNTMQTFPVCPSAAS